MSARISAIASMATRGLLQDVVDAWRKRSGIDVALEAVGGVDALARVQAGEPFDVVVLTAQAIDTLIAAGRIAAVSRIDLVRSEAVIAVRSGAARPDVHSEEALRDAVMAARAIGYSTGPSGVALQKLFARWGIAETLRDRLVQAPPGVPVGGLIARGDVELGFQQRSELVHAEGVDIVGAMPPGLALVTTFSGGIGTPSSRPDAARALLDFVRSNATDQAKERHGLQPAR